MYKYILVLNDYLLKSILPVKKKSPNFYLAVKKLYWKDLLIE